MSYFHLIINIYNLDYTITKILIIQKFITLYNHKEIRAKFKNCEIFIRFA